jgi:hypothetical protein
MPGFLAALAPLGLTVAGGLAGSLPFILSGNGMPSEEEQERMMRRQLEIQDEFDQRKMMRGGMGDDMGDMAGLMSGRPRSLTDLIAEDDMLSELEKVSYKMDRARRARSVGDQELDRILAGQTARIAALQSQRTLSPLEVIQMAEMISG